MQLRRLGPSLRSLLLIGGVVTDAQAQWSVQPDHEWGYTFGYTTSGSFACGAPERMLVGSCSAAGNGITLTNGTASLFLEFVGVTASVTATPTGNLASLGSFTKNVTGTGFTFPYTNNIGFYDYLFAFTLSIVENSPAAGSAQWSGFAFVAPNQTSLRIGYLSAGSLLPVTASPPGTTYGAVALTHFDALTQTPSIYQTITIDGAPNQAEAIATIIPEPKSLVLLSTGFLALAACYLRRRSAPWAGRG